MSSKKKSAHSKTGAIHNNINDFIRKLGDLAILLISCFAMGVALGRVLELMGVVGC